jgi:hypothetical protein
MFARRTAFKDRHGLTLEYELETLLGQSVSFADLPREALRAWGGKATTDSAQTSFISVLDESTAEDVDVEVRVDIEEELVP